MSVALQAVELRVVVPSALADGLAPLCWLLSPQGIVTEDASSLGGRDLQPGQTRLQLYVDPTEASAAAARLQAEVDALGTGGQVERVDVPDQDWNAEWKKHFAPIHVAGRVRVDPAWQQGPAEPGVIQIAIDPGMAFGTGTHETTQLCMTVLCELADAQLAKGQDLAQLSVLDVGTGSAILAILAHRLGYRCVVGTEIDAAATRTARHNAALANLACADALPAPSPDVLTLIHTGDPAVAGPQRYPLVIANILASILIPMRDALLERATPGGTLLLSGILAKQAGEVIAHYQAAGATLLAQRDLNAWTALLLQAPTAAQAK